MNTNQVNQQRVQNILNDLLFMAEDSILTIKKQVDILREKDPYVIPPPEEVKKIADYIKVINTLLDKEEDKI